MADIAEFEKDKASHFTMIQQLKDGLDGKNPDFKELSLGLAKLEAEKACKELGAEHGTTKDDLAKSMEEAKKLKKKLEEMEKAYKKLESSVSKEELQFFDKMKHLEKNLDEISTRYNKSITEQKEFKISLHVAQKKLASREQKNEELKKLNEQLRAKY